MSNDKGFPLCTGYLKKTPRNIMIKRYKELEWERKCAEQGFGKKRRMD